MSQFTPVLTRYGKLGTQIQQRLLFDLVADTEDSTNRDRKVSAAVFLERSGGLSDIHTLKPTIAGGYVSI
ncbi:MAG: hypothetical protein IPP22_10450 [Nitrosomonas sp.]|nr:hypothetical protein [Nitrosomonas sp.]